MWGIASMHSRILGIEVNSFESGSGSLGRGNLLSSRLASFREERDATLSREEVDSTLWKPWSVWRISLTLWWRGGVCRVLGASDSLRGLGSAKGSDAVAGVSTGAFARVDGAEVEVA